MSASITIRCRSAKSERPMFREGGKDQIDVWCYNIDPPHLLKQVAKILGHDDNDESIHRTLARLGK